MMGEAALAAVLALFDEFLRVIPRATTGHLFRGVS